ncbi:MAG: protease family protein [Solirubrobacteraceae bacterium]|jgi:membrane protease YdiL (CAAX protease family)|nr:protease family protein [Solirubrobacteraceae bacterium]
MSVRPPTPVTAPASPQRPADPDGFLWWAPIVAILAAIVAANIVVLFLLGVGDLKGSRDTELSPAGTLIATYAQDAIMIAAAVLFARITVNAVRPATFGIVRPKVDKRLLVVPATFIAFWIVLQVFGHLIDPGAKDDLPDELGAKDTAAAMIAVAVLVCVIAPIVEETMFRGFLFKALQRPLGWIWAAVVSGLVFGGIHAGSAPAVFLLPLAVFGFVLCVVYRKTGSLIPGMGMHALNNGIALGGALDWSLAGTAAAAAISPVVVVAIAWVVARE